MKLKTQIMRNISLNKFFIHSIRSGPAEGEANESARPAQKKPLAIAQIGEVFYELGALSLPFGLFLVAEATVEWITWSIYIYIQCHDFDFDFNVGDNVVD